MRIKLLVAAIGLSFVGTNAFAAQTHDYVERYSAWAQQYRALAPRNNIAANGRCDGISYGTGAMSCGTETGGPVAGLSSRN